MPCPRGAARGLDPGPEGHVDCDQTGDCKPNDAARRPEASKDPKERLGPLETVMAAQLRIRRRLYQIQETCRLPREKRLCEPERVLAALPADPHGPGRVKV